MKRISLNNYDEKVKEFFKRLKVDEEYVLEESGKPSFLIFPPKGREALKAEILSMLQGVWERNREVSEEVIEKEVQEAMKAIRKKYAPGRS